MLDKNFIHANISFSDSSGLSLFSTSVAGILSSIKFISLGKTDPQTYQIILDFLLFCCEFNKEILSHVNPVKPKAVGNMQKNDLHKIIDDIANRPAKQDIGEMQPGGPFLSYHWLLDEKKI